MRFARIGQPGQETPTVMVGEDTYVDISEITADFDGDFLADVDVAALESLVTRAVAAGAVELRAGQRIGAPFTRPHQVLCIGLNYADHAEESGMAIPDEPIVFNKAPNTVIGPFDDVVIPRGSAKTDWEVELGIVIGARAGSSPTRPTTKTRCAATASRCRGIASRPPGRLHLSIHLSP